MNTLRYKAIIAKNNLNDWLDGAGIDVNRYWYLRLSDVSTDEEAYEEQRQWKYMDDDDLDELEGLESSYSLAVKDMDLFERYESFADHYKYVCAKQGPNLHKWMDDLDKRITAEYNTLVRDIQHRKINPKIGDYYER